MQGNSQFHTEKPAVSSLETGSSNWGNKQMQSISLPDSNLYK